MAPSKSPSIALLGGRAWGKIGMPRREDWVFQGVNGGKLLNFCWIRCSHTFGRPKKKKGKGGLRNNTEEEGKKKRKRKSLLWGRNKGLRQDQLQKKRKIEGIGP